MASGVNAPPGPLQRPSRQQHTIPGEEPGVRSQPVIRAGITADLRLGTG